MKIAYVMSRFPHLTETFILREIQALARKGARIRPYPLLVQRQPVVHEAALEWTDVVGRHGLLSLRYLPDALTQAFTRPMRAVRVAWRILKTGLGSPRVLAREIATYMAGLAAATRFEREGVDHVHAHYATYPALLAWVVHELTGLTYSVTIHAHDLFVDRTMLATKLEAAEFVVAISEYNKGFLERVLGAASAAPIHVIRCGVDARLFEGRPMRAGSPELFHILAVGSLQPYKGHEFLVRACALLADRLAFECTIVGEGPERGRLEGLIEESGLAGRVRLAGAKTESDVRTALARADVFVQPSVVEPTGKMEGIPVALMEAMASGVPVIATRISGVPELVRPGQTGTLVDPGDAPALADEIERVANAPASWLAETTGRAGRLVRDDYDLDQNVELLLQLFQVSAGAPKGQRVPLEEASINPV